MDDNTGGLDYWIARDKNKSLFLFIGKPIREDECFYCSGATGSDWKELNSDLFPEITWENSPQKLYLSLTLPITWESLI